jgi:hypothetical protein
MDGWFISPKLESIRLNSQHLIEDQLPHLQDPKTYGSGSFRRPSGMKSSPKCLTTDPLPFADLRNRKVGPIPNAKPITHLTNQPK